MHTVLGWEDVPCVVNEGDSVHQEILTIDENLMRHELSAAERSQQTARRKELYEALHPETSNGAIGNGREKVRQNGEATSRFTRATAAATGQSERNIQRDARRGEKLGGDLPRIKGTSLDSPGEMDALIKMTSSHSTPAPLVYNGVLVNQRDEMLNLTDMWNAAGADPQQRPAKWRDLPATIEFVDHLALIVGKSDNLIRAARGRNGATWAHWQIGLAYATPVPLVAL